MIINRNLAIITGGAIRVGKSITTHLINHGWDVVIHYNSSETQAKELQHTFAKQTNIHLIQQDFSKNLDAKLFFDQCNSITSTPASLLINNASSFLNETIDEISEESFHKQLNINCLMPIMLATEFNQRYTGNVINILDCYAFEHLTHHASHQISKAALLKATGQMALSFAPNTRVNAITLSSVMQAVGQTPTSFQKEIDSALIKHAVNSQDIFSTIDFLIKNQSITGQNIVLDCGRSVMHKL